MEKMKLLCYSMLILLIATAPLQAQDSDSHGHTHGHDHERDQQIVFPDIPGYHTVKTDFHMHTVFSDGSVWPDIRVQEALREGLDVVAFTEHLEYQPHQEDIPHPDRNRSYEVASEAAEGTGLTVVNGSEITRSMPPGHSNAVFVQDANKLLVDDPMAAFEEANRQDAFVFWNHPHWTAQRSDGIARLDDMHKELIEKGLLHGIEVVNVQTYSEEALQIALDHNLTIMGTSDIHGLTDWEYDIPHGGHRSITLVFAEEKTKESVKEALKERRTVVWYKNTFIGLQEFLNPLLKESLQLEVVGYQDDTSVLEVHIKNPTHSEFILQNESTYTFHEDPDLITVDPNSTKTLLVKTRGIHQSITLPFRVMNAIYAPESHPVIEYKLETGAN
ncbi:Sb-PDE family phosphodiesterase [Aliifodinibius sp. S!AR15-10]|uniref:Sb-PDE family phosphodiesterase n=1 Tax=Aliifodinibius sp. S!AR15-10 TaxID=2950437 RepID=UPI00285FC82B|nr:Sb-PDE family phosphodiesterase [Aliifodinibius sp. S!AR15-10]MDR8391284.1 Sb-PDE family phosphodiesterase [Aliifodinibius sp. S!AR15-10]